MAFAARPNNIKRAIVQALEDLSSRAFADGQEIFTFNMGDLEQRTKEVLHTRYNKPGTKDSTIRTHTSNLVTDSFIRIHPDSTDAKGKERWANLTPERLASLRAVIQSWDEREQGPRNAKKVNGNIEVSNTEPAGVSAIPLTGFKFIGD